MAYSPPASDMAATPIGLCGNYKEERLGMRGIGEGAGKDDAVIDPYAGQEWTFACLL